jgi:DNA-binding transcriptional MerR regulator
VPLVPTGVAARELGIHPTTLTRWAKSGMVTPASVTVGGHLRWDLEQLKAELRELRERGDADE